MKISYAWLGRYFAETLPAPDALADLLSMHAWEVDDITTHGTDTVFDIKILADKGGWALSHRGIAHELSVLLERPLKHDPLAETYDPLTHSDMSIGGSCDRYSYARIEGVRVGPSPAWLREALEAVGQRSINNIVDATNFVMLDLGQPLHAFDAEKISGGLSVRTAHTGEVITLLGGTTLTLTDADTVITDSDGALALAGVKGGTKAELTEATTHIILESAHFEAAATRRSMQRAHLHTDAASRFAHGIVHDLAPIALRSCAARIIELAGGTLIDMRDTGGVQTTQATVSLSRTLLNGILGIQLPTDTIRSILDRFGYAYTLNDEHITLTAPFWRSDIQISEDIAEEIIRVHGLEYIPSVVPEPVPLMEINQTFAHTEAIRRLLAAEGFSEIFTSSFRAHDHVPLANALASDKAYLRSALMPALDEALTKNAPHCDLLGVREIRAFEIGTVFTPEREYLALACGVRATSGYKPKVHRPILEAACDKLRAYGIAVSDSAITAEGMVELALSDKLNDLPPVSAYIPFNASANVVQFASPSPYPAISRDIAFWTEGVSVEAAQATLNAVRPDHLVRSDLIDTFTKDGRTSYAFRFVFQSNTGTLTDVAVNDEMERVYTAARSAGYDIR